MKTLEIIKPYDDNTLEFNQETGRYQLTLKYVKTLRDALPYKTDRIAQQRIKQNSLRVYNYIVLHSNAVNRQAVILLLNRTEEGRKYLIEVLTSQMEADLEYAYNDLMVRPLINATNGQSGDRDQYRQNAISLETEMLIEDSVGYFGINLTYMGMFPPYLLNLAREYGDNYE